MRGKIRNRKRAKQLRDFSGLRFGKITPTDIDAFLEFSDKLFVWIESKRVGASLPYGQKLALERVCDAVQEVRELAVVLVVEHDVSVEKDIDLAKARVRLVRRDKAWTRVKEEVSCKEYIDVLRHETGFRTNSPVRVSIEKREKIDGAKRRATELLQTMNNERVRQALIAEKYPIPVVAKVMQDIS